MIIFLSLGSRIYTPGVKINLPTADNQPGTDKPTVTVALDESGRYFFQNQIIEAESLQNISPRSPNNPPNRSPCHPMDKAVPFET